MLSSSPPSKALVADAKENAMRLRRSYRAVSSIMTDPVFEAILEALQTHESKRGPELVKHFGLFNENCTDPDVDPEDFYEDDDADIDDMQCSEIGCGDE